MPLKAQNRLIFEFSTQMEQRYEKFAKKGLERHLKPRFFENLPMKWNKMEKLKRAFEQLNIPSDENLTEKFRLYMEKILEWNEHINLTAITDKDEFVDKHFVDSILSYGRAEIENARTVIDIGTGAGFPGIPLAFVYPDKKFVLADSLNKRLKVIDQLCKEIGILNVELVHARAEELGKNKAHREKYDLCVSRAVANFATLSEYCLPLVKKDGFFMAYKGPDAEREIEESGKAVSLLGGKVTEIFKPTLSNLDFSHNLVMVRKIKNTPAKFPRKAGTPAKEPLK